MTRRSYGWKRDSHDSRDHLLLLPPEAPHPPAVDLRPDCPPVYDQGQLGSCTGNAIAGAVEFDLLKQGLADFTPSRLFVYYWERALEGTVREDAGAAIRDGIKVVAKRGVCSEATWPYDIDRFAAKPGTVALAEALKTRASSYRRVVGDLRPALAAGHPVVFGFDVYESFESDEVARTGVMPMPRRGERMLGGHAVLAVGYDDPSQRLIVRNSWGSGWGQAGYFTMPYAYLPHTSDPWTVEMVS